MQNLQLYLNDQLADLSDDIAIALTFQINNLADVQSQQGNTSNQFKLPLTQNNRRILGFPDDITFTNELPYLIYDARIIQNGIEVIPYGIAELNQVDNTTADLVVLSGNVDYFDNLEPKIYDMGDKTTITGIKKTFAPFEHIWNVANVAQSQKKTEGWIWPVLDYGKIPIDISGNTVEIDVRTQRPGFFLKTAIELMTANAGYKIKPDCFLLKQPLYPKLIVQFANDNFEHGSDYQNQPDNLGMSASTGMDKSVSHFAVTDIFGKGIFIFSNLFSDIDNQFSGGQTFTAKQIITAEVNLVIPRFRFQGRPNGSHPSNINLIIFVHTTLGDIQTSLNYDLSSEGFTRVEGTSGNGLKGYHEFGEKKLSTEVNLQVGDQISIRWEFFGDRTESFTLYSGATLSIKAKNEGVLYGQTVQCERIFPDISQKDLLKDTLQRFGIICQTDNTNKTVNFSSFKEIFSNIPIARDWSDKCVDMGKNTTFKLGSYAQVNTLTYKEDGGVLPKKFADSQINIDDRTMDASTVLFESQFAPTLNRPFFGGSIAQILKVDTANDDTAIDFTISTSARILIDQKISLLNFGKTVIFKDGNPANNIPYNDQISAPYFYKPGASDSLLWEDLRKLYYPELESILKRAKRITRYFLLTPRDILELDLTIPVFNLKDSAYFYISKIDSWKYGQPVKIELIKLY